MGGSMQVFFEYGLADIEYKHVFNTLQGSVFTVYTSSVGAMHALETVAERLTNDGFAYESQSFYYKDMTTVRGSEFFEEEYIDLGAGDCIEDCMHDCCTCESADLWEVIDAYCNAKNLFLRPEIRFCKKLWTFDNERGETCVALNKHEIIESEGFSSVRCAKNAYVVRLSASGYLDCTEWTVFESESEALRYACEQIETD